eukprot:RCo033074
MESLSSLAASSSSLLSTVNRGAVDSRKQLIRETWARLERCGRPKPFGAEVPVRCTLFGMEEASAEERGPVVRKGAWAGRCGAAGTVEEPEGISSSGASSPQLPTPDSGEPLEPVPSGAMEYAQDIATLLVCKGRRSMEDPHAELTRKLLARSRQLEQCKAQWSSAKHLLRVSQDDTARLRCALSQARAEARAAAERHSAELGEATARAAQAQATADGLREELREAREQLRTLAESARSAVGTTTSNAAAAPEPPKDAGQPAISLSSSLSPSQTSSAAESARCEKLRRQVAELTAELRASRREAVECGRNFQLFQELWEQLEKEKADLQEALLRREQDLSVLQAHACESEKVRRSLRSALQDLRGKIRVCVRVRPVLPFEG